MVTSNPLLSAAGVIATAFLLTRPVYLRECLLVKFIGSVEKGLGQFLFFNKKAELFRVMAQAISDMMAMLKGKEYHWKLSKILYVFEG